jgi:alkylhydroperoxidase family enzyme
MVNRLDHITREESPMPTFPDHDATTSPPAARPMVESAAAQFGFVPRPVARMATAPSALHGFLRLNAIFQKSSLDELAREVLILTVAARNSCHYCVAMHSALLADSQPPEGLLDDLRAERPLTIPRLEAIRVFTNATMDHAGAVPDHDMSAFLGAGYTIENALDVVLGVATYTLSTFANRMTGAPVDDAFHQWTWDKREPVR